MRSVVVVLPASMCAAMPMFRVHSSGNGRSFELTGETLALSVTTVIFTGAETADMRKGPDWLPAEVGEGAIRLRHLVRVFLLLHDTAGVVVGVDDLGREGLPHRRALATRGRVNDPAQREALLALKRNFHRHLVGGATDAAALHLEAGTGVFQRAEQQVDRVALLELLRNLFKRAVDDALGKVLLAALHDDVDQVGDERAAVAGVRGDLAFFGSVAA